MKTKTCTCGHIEKPGEILVQQDDATARRRMPQLQARPGRTYSKTTGRAPSRC